MKLFRGKNDEIPQDSTQAGSDYVSANISVAKKPGYCEISIIVVDAANGDTVYKASFRSKVRSDYAAYNTAIDMINVFLAQEELFLAQEPTTNAALPSITTHQRGGRWK
ncbi:hypothetical protein [Planococcus sp. S3-L1]|uniref:hypothetical protein n=1 Tax=Planococcus sp. S3-L1 TaxID=3046200 RepID=UPI0024BA2C01|nr:hypothetical protein [Planococcus sp. S3-L1]MDJ0332115.1 hypothetical protein [Planococcus sp. S3-L1]